MKLKDFTKWLLKVEQDFGGDLEVVHSKDEEGNSYSTLDPRSLAIVYDNPDDPELKPVGVVIYPWIEGFGSAEEAVRGEHDEKY